MAISNTNSNNERFLESIKHVHERIDRGVLSTLATNTVEKVVSSV